MRVILILTLLLSACSHVDTLPQDFDIDKGYPETFFTPMTNCWVQPPNSTDWFVCGHAPGQKEQLEKELQQGHQHNGHHEL